MSSIAVMPQGGSDSAQTTLTPRAGWNKVHDLKTSATVNKLGFFSVSRHAPPWCLVQFCRLLADVRVTQAELEGHGRLAVEKRHQRVPAHSDEPMGAGSNDERYTKAWRPKHDTRSLWPGCPSSPWWP